MDYEPLSSEEVLRLVQERSEDIDHVTILCPGLMYRGLPALADFALLIHTESKNWMVNRHNAEIVLNDGILSRMNVRIEFAPVPRWS